MMQQMRENTKIVMLVVAIAFIGYMGFEGWQSISGRTAAAQLGALGRVNGQNVSSQAYQNTYQQLYEQARQQSGGQLTHEQQKELEKLAWDQTVDAILLQQEIQRRGIQATNAEIREAALNMPHPALMNNELFQTNGQFDINKYRQFLTGPSANEELLLQLEQYYREAIPRAKLIRQVTAGLYLSDQQLWRDYQDQHETTTVEYIPLDVAKLVPGAVTVSDAEVQAYYKAHAAEFKRPAQATFTIAALSKRATAADSAAALERARSARAEIVGGADFAKVAERESADSASARMGGELGLVHRGQTVPTFEAAVFSQPVGQISEPILSPFGYHIIQVQERSGDAAKVRHILIPIAPTEQALDRLFAKADTLESLATTGTLANAARVTGAALERGITVSETRPVVPGIGSALEALDWAKDEATTPKEEGAKPATVSPIFETPDALYLVKLEKFAPAGEIPQAEAAAQIRGQLTLQKKEAKAREIGQQMVAEIRGGKSLQDVAAAHGLEVLTAGPFARIGFAPGLGTANEAIGAAFGVPVGGVSNVVKAQNGLVILRPTARTEADHVAWEAQKEQQRAIETARLQQEEVARWMEGLRKKATIEDQRAELRQRSRGA